MGEGRGEGRGGGAEAEERRGVADGEGREWRRTESATFGVDASRVLPLPSHFSENKQNEKMKRNILKKDRK